MEQHVVNLCEFAILHLLPTGWMQSAIGNCKFCRGTRRGVCETLKFLTVVTVIINLCNFMQEKHGNENSIT